MTLLKKGLSIFIAGMMTVGMFTGCGSSAPKDNDKPTENKLEDKTDGDKADSGEKTKFTIATVRWTDAWPVDFLEEGVFKELEEKHNIEIEWQVYYNSDWAEQKSLLLASGDLPDAFFGSIALNDIDISQNKSYFLELTDLIDENMPNLKSVFEKEPALLARAQNRDNEIYSLVKKLPLRPKVAGDVMFINKNWLDNLGLEVPSDYKEFEEVLVAFKNQDADGDGNPDNEFPITGNAGAQLSSNLRLILAPFGTMVSRDTNYMGINKEGEPVFMPAQENYKEAVKWMHGLYAQGLVDPEYFTQEQSAAKAKIQAEGGSQVGAFFGWTADSQAGVNVDEFVQVEALAGPDGERYAEAATDYLDISDRELVITTKCEDPAKLLQWADDFYTDLVSLQTFYGPIPDQIKDNGDSTYEVLVPADGSSLDTSAWSYSTRDFGPKYMNPEFYDQVILPTDQGDGVKLAQDELNAKHVREGTSIAFPMVKYTTEELEQLATLEIDLFQFAEAKYAEWVINGGVDEEWDEYINQLNAMGLEEFMEIQNTAYEAYLETMK